MSSSWHRYSASHNSIKYVSKPRCLSQQRWINDNIQSHLMEFSTNLRIFWVVCYDCVASGRRCESSLLSKWTCRRPKSNITWCLLIEIPFRIFRFVTNCIFHLALIFHWLSSSVLDIKYICCIFNFVASNYVRVYQKKSDGNIILQPLLTVHVVYI